MVMSALVEWQLLMLCCLTVQRSLVSSWSFTFALNTLNSSVMLEWFDDVMHCRGGNIRRHLLGFLWRILFFNSQILLSYICWQNGDHLSIFAHQDSASHGFFFCIESLQSPMLEITFSILTNKTKWMRKK